MRLADGSGISIAGNIPQLLGAYSCAFGCCTREERLRTSNAFFCLDSCALALRVIGRQTNQAASVPVPKSETRAEQLTALDVQRTVLP